MVERISRFVECYDLRLVSSEKDSSEEGSSEGNGRLEKVMIDPLQHAEPKAGLYPSGSDERLISYHMSDPHQGDWLNDPIEQEVSQVRRHRHFPCSATA